DDKTVKLWDLNGKLILEMKDLTPAAVNSAVFSPDGTKILTASRNGTVSVWLMLEDIVEWLKTANIYRLSEEDRKEFGIKDSDPR
ncbi:MAG: hypothetical protein F6K26_49180, partial [Moorea sp. SIO2I5]|nr:hypothetical protein [Moorena sp. SIO2I5]